MKTLLASFFTVLTLQLSSITYTAPTPEFKPRIEVSAVYIEHKDHILLLHRHEHKSEGNKWGIPGGKVKKNETPLQAAIREVQEETGFDISHQDIQHVQTVYIEYNESDHFIYHMFRTRLQGNPGAVKINYQEHKGFTWVTPEDSLNMDLLQDEDPCIRLAYFNQ